MDRSMSKRARACPYAEKALELPSECRTRGKNGGARPGAGRHMNDSEPQCFSLSRAIREKLERFGALHGIKRQRRNMFFNAVLEKLLAQVEVKEPEYLSLIPKG